MKINNIIYLLLLLVYCNCRSFKNIPNDKDALINISADETQNGSAFIKAATEKVDKLIENNKFTPFAKLQQDKVENAEANLEIKVTRSKKEEITGNQMYHKLQKSTMYIGTSYLCNKCPNMHLSVASGFVIHEDGIVVTNYHVVDAKKEIKEQYGLFVIDHKGVVYDVTEVLSASKDNDLAILKIETHGEKLIALPLAETELVGEDVYMMGHPFRNTFFMTKGIISRKFEGSKNNPRISITAKFGVGASGGPVVNNSGQVVGVVSATHGYYSNHSKENGDLQLTVNIVIPVSQLNKYIK